VQSGQPPMAEAEELSDEQRTMETVMLGMRLATGLPAAAFDSAIVTELRGQGLVSEGEQLVLTERGRLLADAVIRALLAGPQTSEVA
jgi:coproporphyrinogen III oxidase-like Fe-S oxidoreductase